MAVEQAAARGLYLPFVDEYCERLVRRRIAEKGWDFTINGPRPTDLQVRDPAFFRRLCMNPTLGFGEAYMDKQIDVEDMEGFLKKMGVGGMGNSNKLKRWVKWLFNGQTISKSKQVAEEHYDVGNDLYEAMLDPYMQYSCGYWAGGASTLEECQLAKLDLIARKLQLTDDLQVLDIGCGFGGLASYLAERYNVQVVGCTISKEQLAIAKERFYHAGKTEFVLQDYRVFCSEPTNKLRFDRVVCVGMFEHVGAANYRNFFEMARACMKPKGIFILHTIGYNCSMVTGNDWVDKYIFPNGCLPSIAQIGAATEKIFVMEDWHNFGTSYAKTLKCWQKTSRKFFDNLGTEQQDRKYGERFQRMWRLYLALSVVGFETRLLQLWQILLSPKGLDQNVVRQQ